MGCGASNSRLNKAVTVESQESLLSTINNTNEARDMLAKIRILNPVQRRRARSVGLPEENGVYWVYWRPVRAQGRGLRANTEKEDLWPEVLEKQQTRSRNSWTFHVHQYVTYSKWEDEEKENDKTKLVARTAMILLAMKITTLKDYLLFRDSATARGSEEKKPW